MYKLDYIDDKDRYFTLLDGDKMQCVFTNKGETSQVGWCVWSREDGVWYVVNTSRGKGEAIAKPGFGEILDHIFAQLIFEKELSYD